MGWSWKRRLLVTSLIVIVAFSLSWLMVRQPAAPPIIDGTVTDDSGNPISHATIALPDGTKLDTSEDNGNFKLDLTGRFRVSDRVRLIISKDGYAPADASVEVPSKGYVVKLRHL